MFAAVHSKWQAIELTCRQLAPDSILDCRHASHSIGLVDQLLRTVNGKLNTWTYRYGICNVPDDMNFQLELLKLTAFFCRRDFRSICTPPQDKLSAYRRINRERAEIRLLQLKKIQFTAPKMSLEPHDLAANRLMLRIDRRIPDDLSKDFYGSMESFSLLDLLPFFLVVSAEFGDHNVNEEWMKLAAEWMLQASLEQYLVYGAKGEERATEAFAWGMLKNCEGIHSEDVRVNMLFTDSETGKEIRGWSDLLGRFALEVSLRHLPEDDELKQYERLWRVYDSWPPDRFEEKVLQFLDNVRQAKP